MGFSHQKEGMDYMLLVPVEPTIANLASKPILKSPI